MGKSVIYNDNNAVRYYEEISKSVGLFSFEKEIIQKFFPEKSKVLDIGCGAGRTTYPLHEMKYDVIGIDLSKKMIEKARRLHPEITYHVCDARNLKMFADSSFNCALFSFNGFSMIPTSDRQRTIREIRRVLSQGGIFTFSNPYINMNNPYWKDKQSNLGLNLDSIEDRERLGNEIFNDNGQTVNMNVVFMDDMSKLMTENGFEVLLSGSTHELFGPGTEDLNDTSVWVIKKICS